MFSIKNDRRATITFLDGKVREFDHLWSISGRCRDCRVYNNANGEKLIVYHHAVQTIDVVPLNA